ncbi:acyl-CoA carboxylase subunit epsilon [Cellulomonas sp. URHD0024]|uniref:acyl-CoA carboxylase subunit epsilon n=1 Tax=Cellulomonas sp. URHD0024 TaxID=1302620 RepID=UPI00040F38CC|nr:acyl-CoA carboxylase subunit epsilon [Cellulomonas sp. URHD0024]
MSDAPESTQMQVVRGTPDDVELAALVAGLMAAASERAGHAEPAVDGVAAPWADRRRTMRGVRDDALRPGPDAWRWSLRA